MRKLFAVRTPRFWIIATVGILVLCAAYSCFIDSKKPLAPPVPVVSACKELSPGRTRIGEQNGFQFDVAAKNFAISEGTQDMPPAEHGFRLRSRNSGSLLDISFRQFPMQSMAAEPALTFSNHVEKRDILDDTGHSVGEDYCGYLKTGECWRQARLFKGGVVAKYSFVNKQEAELFDQVIGSACVLPSGL
jgi:hypothetical protein